MTQAYRHLQALVVGGDDEGEEWRRGFPVVWWGELCSPLPRRKGRGLPVLSPFLKPDEGPIRDLPEETEETLESGGPR